jgi:hypothetical protein
MNIQRKRIMIHRDERVIPRICDIVLLHDCFVCHYYSVPETRYTPRFTMCELDTRNLRKYDQVFEIEHLRAYTTTNIQLCLAAPNATISTAFPCATAALVRRGPASKTGAHFHQKPTIDAMPANISRASIVWTFGRGEMKT